MCVWPDIFVGHWPSWDRYLVYVCSQNLYSGADLSKRHAASWDSIWLRVELCCSDCPALKILLACIPSLKQNFNGIPNKLKCKVNYSAMLVHSYKHVYSTSELAMLLFNLFNYPFKKSNILRGSSPSFWDSSWIQVWPWARNYAQIIQLK